MQCAASGKTLSEAAVNDFRSFTAAEHGRAPVLSPCVSPRTVRVRGFCFLQESVAPPREGRGAKKAQCLKPVHQFKVEGGCWCHSRTEDVSNMATASFPTAVQS